MNIRKQEKKEEVGKLTHICNLLPCQHNQEEWYASYCRSIHHNHWLPFRIVFMVLIVDPEFFGRHRFIHSWRDLWIRNESGFLYGKSLNLNLMMNGIVDDISPVIISLSARYRLQVGNFGALHIFLSFYFNNFYRVVFIQVQIDFGLCRKTY